MTLASGTTLGPYRITGQIGAGGMGEVYRALDTRLDRQVAIKVLPPELAADPERRERFEREARAVSSLNHPSICTLHDVGEQDGTHFLVMELVEGETLADRLARGRLPLERALADAIAIADALAQAHRHGVVHRDLKPGNVMITPSGVKLLDFGLAKLRDERGVSAFSQVQTQDASSPLTQGGTILGTPQYMAPEQLEGKAADARADVFALGAVLYEMVTGRKAFDAQSQASLIGAIMQANPPPMKELEASTPPALEHVVMRCLAKDPDDRWQSVRDVKAELQFIGQSRTRSREPDVTSLGSDRRPWMLSGALALALVAVVMVTLLRWPSTSPSTAPVTRFRIDAAGSANLSVALSPDGQRIAYVGRSESGNAIWVHALDSLESRMLPGTEGITAAAYPFWSFDSRFVVFRDGGELRKVEASGGPVETITAGFAGNFRRGDWSSDGTILAATDVVYRLPATGGEAVPVTRLDESLGEIAHSGPWFLPDNRHFLFKTTTADPRNRGVYLGSLDPGEPRRRLLEASRAIYVQPGFILFARGQVLYAQPFDADRLEFTGDPVQIADNLVYSETLDTTAFEASDEGTLILRSVEVQRVPEVPLAWRDRAGGTTRLGVAVEPVDFRLSPDGKRLAFSSGSPSDLWVLDLDRGVRTRLTNDPETDHNPIWSPDGSSLVFDSHRGGARGIYQKPANGAVPERRLFDAGANHVVVTDWSRDGQFLVFARDRTVGGVYDIWVLPLSGDGEPFEYMRTARSGVLSPDGRRMAYTTNESGVAQVVVQPFPDPSGGKWQVSVEGGALPQWARDGRELYYVDAAGLIVRVDVTTDPVFEVGEATRVSESTVFGSWSVTADGDRLLTTAPDAPAVPDASGDGSSPITVVLNWTSLLDE